MQTVGIRELKNRLSEYLRRVQAGEEFLVTDRGRVVAELAPPLEGGAADALPPGLVRLARQGRLRLGERNSTELYPAQNPTPTGTGQRLLDEERGER